MRRQRLSQSMNQISSTVRTMRAAVIPAAGEIRIEAIGRPEPASGQVRIRMQGCGVCASNLAVWSGPEWMRFPTEPGALGHEGWGIVDAVADDVQGLSVGDRVAALSYHSYAEYDVADAAAVVPLPAALDGEPFPGEPLGCAMNIFRRSEIGAGDTIAIVGIGFLGALLTRLATNAGAHVVAISRRPFSLEVARRMGAAECIQLDGNNAIERVKALTENELCDRVIEATGKQQPL